MAISRLPSSIARIGAVPVVSALLLAGCGESEPSASTPTASDPLGLARPTNPDDLTSMSGSQLWMEGSRAAKAGNAERAVELLRLALEKEPNSPQAHFDLGTLLVPMASTPVLGSASRDFDVLDEALEHLARAVELTGDNPSYRYWYGRALDLRGRDDDAIAELGKAVELNPEYGKAYKRLGLVHAEAGRIDEAQAAFTRALELSPRDAGLHYQLGNLALDGAPEAAREHFERALERNPMMAQAHHGLSQALAQLGDTAGAEAAAARAEALQGQRDTLNALEQRAQAQPGSVEAQFQAAQANFLLNKLDRAKTLFWRVVQLQPDHPQAHYHLGLIWMGEEDWTMAMNHFEESLYFAPEQVGARVELLRTCAALKLPPRIEELAAELETMMDREGIGAAERNAVAEVFLEIGRREAAIRYLRAVLAEDPENEVATILLERAQSEG